MKDFQVKSFLYAECDTLEQITCALSVVQTQVKTPPQLSLDWIFGVSK